MARTATLAAAAGAIALAVAPAAGGEGGSVLPDLTPVFPSPELSYLDTFQARGRVLYRFDSVIMNVGRGSLEIVGTRPPDPASPLTGLWQVEYGEPGVPSAPPDALSAAPAPGEVARVDLLARGGQVVYGNDGHEHFHFIDAARYVLQTRRGHDVAFVGKVGFCMFDTFGFSSYGFYEPGPGTNQWCRYGQPAADVVRMGISPGRGDLYARDLLAQWVDVTGRPPGRYQLFGQVDPKGILDETDKSNNITRQPRLIPGVTAGKRVVRLRSRRPAFIPLRGRVVGPNALIRSSRHLDREGSPTLARIGSAVRYRIVRRPRHGRLTSARGGVVYQPGRGFAGHDSFRYVALAAHGLLRSPPASVTVR